jgi:hypothetical protein
MALSERQQFKAYVEGPGGKSSFNVFNHKGIFYIIAEQSAEFRLNIICNEPTNTRYAMRLNIDGNDVLAGIKTIKTNTYIHGFKKDENTFTAFCFDYPPMSNLEENYTYHGTIKIDFYHTKEQVISKKRFKKFTKRNYIPVYATSKTSECLSVVEGSEVHVDSQNFNGVEKNTKLICDFNNCIDTLMIKYLEFHEALNRNMVSITLIPSLILIKCSI